jgi:hypothetical protein
VTGRRPLAARWPGRELRAVPCQAHRPCRAATWVEPWFSVRQGRGRLLPWLASLHRSRWPYTTRIEGDTFGFHSCGHLSASSRCPLRICGRPFRATMGTTKGPVSALPHRPGLCPITTARQHRWRKHQGDRQHDASGETGQECDQSGHGRPPVSQRRRIDGDARLAAPSLTRQFSKCSRSTTLSVVDGGNVEVVEFS